MRFHFRTLMNHKVTVPPLWKDMVFFIRDGFILGAICQLVLIYSNSYDYLVSKSVVKVLERRRMDDFRLAEQMHVEKIREDKSSQLEYLKTLKQKKLEQKLENTEN